MSNPDAPTQGSPPVRLAPAAGAAAAAILTACLLAAPLTRTSEGTRHVAYHDPVGILTVCTGHTGTDVVARRAYSDGECEAILARDEQAAGFGIARCIKGDVPLQSRAAFTDFALNVGVAAFCGSTLARKLNAADLAGACDQLPLWTKAGGRVLPGLVKRRAAERDLCREGLK